MAMHYGKICLALALGSVCAPLVQAGTNGLDKSFGNGGIALFSHTASGASLELIKVIKVQSDGKFIVAGRSVSPGISVAAIGRLESGGTWDEQFADHVR